jgi:hypothetical protein
MLRCAIACVILTILPAGPAAAGEKNSPKLTQETREAIRLTQQNIVKMKLKTVQSPPSSNTGVPLILPSTRSPKVPGN